MSPLDIARQRLLWATTERNRALEGLRRRQRAGTDAAIRRAQERYQLAREAVRLAREAVEVELGREA